jgi:hypothetical protein
MRLILTMCFLVFLWVVGFHDGHNPKPDIQLCPNGQPALIDWHGHWCEEMKDEPKPEPRLQGLQREWRDA